MEKILLCCFGVLAIGLLMVGSLPSPASALDISVINDVPDGHPRMKYALQLEADAAKASGGAIRLTTNRKVPGKAGLDALLAGKDQIAALNSAHLEAVDPRIGFVNLPFMMSDTAMFRPGALDKIIALMQKQIEAKGLVILGVMRGADSLFVFKERKVLKPDDLKGVKLRVVGEGLVEKIMVSLGAEPVAMPITAMQKAMAEGKVEGTATSPGGWTSQLAKLAPTGSQVPGLNLLTYTYVAKKSWLDSLTPEQRKIITDCVRGVSTDQWRAMYDDDKVVIDNFVKTGGGTYTVVPEKDIELWREKVAPVSADFDRQYPDLMNAARDILAGK
jgi:TRAP-type C4-dicarboxylate transport system substrate-binding protein